MNTPPPKKKNYIHLLSSLSIFLALCVPQIDSYTASLSYACALLSCCLDYWCVRGLHPDPLHDIL